MLRLGLRDIQKKENGIFRSLFFGALVVPKAHALQELNFWWTHLNYCIH